MAEPAKSAPSSERSGAPKPDKPRADILSILIFGLVSLNLISVGGMGYFLRTLWAQLREVQAQQQTLKQPVREAAAIPEPKGTEIGVLYPIESFLVNINSDQGPKFLQTQMEFELADPGVENEIARKKPAIRDAIILLLSSRNYRELRDEGGMKRLRADMLRVVNNLLTTGKVKSIFFTQFHFN
jgi:flagellar FliL protein